MFDTLGTKIDKWRSTLCKYRINSYMNPGVIVNFKAHFLC